MEDTLRDTLSSVCNENLKVLILVLMEDTLRETYFLQKNMLNQQS